MTKRVMILAGAAVVLAGVFVWRWSAAPAQDLPVAETTTVRLYFYDPARDQGPGGPQCSESGLVAVERVVPKSAMQLRDAVRLLLQGDLTDAERAAGLTSPFPLPGLMLETVAIMGTEAVLLFADPQNQSGGGSCRISIMRMMIEATARQFPGTSQVRFSPEELFQP